MRYLKYLSRAILITAGISAASSVVFSQGTGTCAENLKNAQALFEKGQVDLVQDMLSGCLKSGFNREEELAAFKLLIQTYLFEDKIMQADSTMLAFLKKNPEYQLSPTDHSSFVFLFNNFRVKPVLHLTFHFGTNAPFLTFIDPHTVAPELGPNSYSSGVLNLFTSVEAKYPLNRKIELNVEMGYSRASFTNIEEFQGFGEIKYTEVQNNLQVPATISYNYFNSGRFTGFFRAGLGTSFNLSSSANATLTPLGQIFFQDHTGPDISRDDSRIFLDIFTQVGAGVKFKTPGGFISMELRSNFGFLPQVKTGGLSSEELRSRYYFLDDDFNLNTFNLNLGYTQIFYKPSKKK